MPPSGRALPRQVQLFGWVSLLNDFASEMIYPLLPAFVTGVLGGGPQALGALDGAAEFAAAVVKRGAGRRADQRDPTEQLDLACWVGARRPWGRSTGRRNSRRPS